MLVITRKQDQWVHLVTATGELISICIAKQANKYVALGFNLPDSTAVVRGELFDEMAAKGVDMTSAASINDERVRCGQAKAKAGA